MTVRSNCLLCAWHKASTALPTGDANFVKHRVVPKPPTLRLHAFQQPQDSCFAIWCLRPTITLLAHAFQLLRKLGHARLKIRSTSHVGLRTRAAIIYIKWHPLIEGLRKHIRCLCVWPTRAACGDGRTNDESAERTNLAHNAAVQRPRDHASSEIGRAHV